MDNDYDAGMFYLKLEKYEDALSYFLAVKSQAKEQIILCYYKIDLNKIYNGKDMG